MEMKENIILETLIFKEVVKGGGSTRYWGFSFTALNISYYKEVWVYRKLLEREDVISRGFLTRIEICLSSNSAPLPNTKIVKILMNYMHLLVSEKNPRI